MNRIVSRIGRLTAVLGTLLVLCGWSVETPAFIEGMEPTSVGANGPVFHLTARCDFISTADGGSVLIWGYAPGRPGDPGRAQYPGPTLIANEGETVTIILHNQVTDETGHLLDGTDGRPAINVSAVFPGQTMLNVTNDPGTPGLITREALPGGTVRYRFKANNPGTYMYHSGTRPDLQVELGLLGALIVRPALGANYAYNSADTAFVREYLFVLSEMDPTIHDLVEFDQMDQIDNTSYYPVYWFINGRTAPDTMAPRNAEWLPTQPYNCVPRVTPGEKILMRVIGAGRDLHPFHHHADNSLVIAKNGVLLESVPDGGTGADLAYSVFTIQSIPGETVDAIFDWTDKGMGWDIYGHEGVPADCHAEDLVDNETGAATPDGFHDTTYEWCENHGKQFPVVLPNNLDLTFGGFWSGSPFMGAEGGLPPGEGGLNANAGFAFMWHSHTEKEMCNFDIFPGGMMTMFLVDPPGTAIAD